jgi:hypothetical protein
MKPTMLVAAFAAALAMQRRFVRGLVEAEK